MKLIRTIESLRSELAPLRRQGKTIGVVPTMGFLHEGHRSLMRASVDVCDVTVLTLFVNPTQFNDPKDLEAYPRDEKRDALMAEETGVDFLFAPEVAEMYPAGASTKVVIRGITEPLEGASRGVGHFDGVTTIVAKLFNIVQPDVAFFGQKDAQQALVIRKMVRDLDMPIRIEVCPTVREPDGLATDRRPWPSARAWTRPSGRSRPANAVPARSKKRAAKPWWPSGFNRSISQRSRLVHFYRRNCSRAKF